jgi:catechol 2,3-dioxygenase-like lactoylglutathione lyase family enzyme
MFISSRVEIKGKLKIVPQDQKESLNATAFDLPSPRISEIVLRTPNFEKMKDWYQLVLSAKPSFEYELEQERPAERTTKVENFRRLCFLRVFSQFPYTQVLALFDVPGLPVSENHSGLHHMQFREASLEHLVRRYEMLSAAGIAPYQSFNHGPSISFYYKDPDGNLAEMSGPSYEAEADYLAFFKTPAFAKNPAGVEIDAADFVARFRRGEDRRKLVSLPE